MGFLVLSNKLPQTGQLKIVFIYLLSRHFLWIGVQVKLDCVLGIGSYEAIFKVLIRLCFNLEAQLDKNMLTFS